MSGASVNPSVGKRRGDDAETLRDPRRETKSNRLVDRQPRCAVVLSVERDLGVHSYLGCVESYLVRGRVGEPDEREREPRLLPQFSGGRLIGGLARLTGAGWRRPGPVALEIDAAGGQTVKDKELARVSTRAPHDDARRLGRFVRDG